VGIGDNSWVLYQGRSRRNGIVNEMFREAGLQNSLTVLEE
jgi:hypothetical protein